MTTDFEQMREALESALPLIENQIQPDSHDEHTAVAGMIRSALRLLPPASSGAGGEPVKCRGRNSYPEPQDCDWPFCGCDPHADRVLAALEESGHVVTRAAPAAAVADASLAALIEKAEDQALAERGPPNDHDYRDRHMIEGIERVMQIYRALAADAQKGGA